MAKSKGVKTNQGKMEGRGVHKTVDVGGKSDGGGSSDVARVAKAINSPKKGGAPGL